MREARPLYFLIGAVLICLTAIFCTELITRSMVRIRSKDELIHVDGSARKPIRSDFIIWNGSLRTYFKTQRSGQVHASVGTRARHKQV